MTKKSSDSAIDRRTILKSSSAAIGSSLALGSTGTAAASDRTRYHWRSGRGRRDRGSRGTESPDCSVRQISSEGDTIDTLVEVHGETFLFKEAASHRNANQDVAKSTTSAQSGVKTYDATESGHPVEFQKVDSTVSASDVGTNGPVQTQGIDFTPENFLERYEVDYKKISDSCGDILWNSHYALEFHFETGGAFSAIGVAGLSALICYAAAGATVIPTGGFSGGVAAGGCGGFAAAVDQLIDVDMIPNSTTLSIDFWDQDETTWWGNTSPTVAVGLEPGWEVNWTVINKIGEYDKDMHLGYDS